MKTASEQERVRGLPRAPEKTRHLLARKQNSKQGSLSDQGREPGMATRSSYLVAAGIDGGFSPNGPTAMDTLTMPFQSSVILIKHVFSGFEKLR